MSNGQRWITLLELVAEDGGGMRWASWAGDGSTAAFDLPELRTPESAVVVVVNGVIQAEGAAFSVADATVTTITFAPWVPETGDLVSCWYQSGAGSVTLRYSNCPAASPDAWYEPLVLDFGSLTRAIPLFPGLIQVSDVGITLDNATLVFSKLLGDYPLRGAKARIRIGIDGAALSSFSTIFTGRIAEVSLTGKACQLRIKDSFSERLNEDIGGRFTETLFPNLAGRPVQVERAPVVYGVVSGEGGRVPCQYVGKGTDGKHQYVVARHPVASVDAVYQLNAPNASLTPTWVTDGDPASPTYRWTFLTFDDDMEPPPDAETGAYVDQLTISADVTGAVDENGLLLVDPPWMFLHFLGLCCGFNTLTETDRWSFLAAAEELVLEPILGAGVIHQAMAVGTAMSWFAVNYGMDVYTRPDGLLAVKASGYEAATVSTPGVNHLSHILRDGFSLAYNHDVINACQPSHTWDPVANKFVTTLEPLKNHASIASYGSEKSESLQLPLVSETHTAEEIAKRRLWWGDDGRAIVQLQLSAPVTPGGVELAHLFNATHYAGPESGGAGWVDVPLKVLSLQYALRSTPALQITAVTMEPNASSYLYLAPPLPVPGGTISESDADASFTVTWGAPPGSGDTLASHLEVYCRDAADTSGPHIFAGRVEADPEAGRAYTFTPDFGYTVESKSVDVWLRPQNARGVKLPLSGSSKMTLADIDRKRIGAVSGLVAVQGADSVTLAWTHTADTKWSHYWVYRNTVDDAATATRLQDSLAASTYADSGLAGRDDNGDLITYHYWVYPMSRSASKGAVAAVASAPYGDRPPRSVADVTVCEDPYNLKRLIIRWSLPPISPAPGEDQFGPYPEAVQILFRFSAEEPWQRRLVAQVPASDGIYTLPLPPDEYWERTIYVYVASVSATQISQSCEPEADPAVKTVLTVDVDAVTPEWAVEDSSVFDNGDGTIDSEAICGDEQIHIQSLIQGRPEDNPPSGLNLYQIKTLLTPTRKPYNRTARAAHAAGAEVFATRTEATMVSLAIRRLEDCGDPVDFFVSADGPMFTASWGNPLYGITGNGLEYGEPVPVPGRDSDSYLQVPDTVVHHWELCYSPHRDFAPPHDLRSDPVPADAVLVADIGGQTHEKHGYDPTGAYYWAIRCQFADAGYSHWVFLNKPPAQWESSTDPLVPDHEWPANRLLVSARQVATRRRDPLGRDGLQLDADSSLLAIDLGGAEVSTEAYGTSSGAREALTSAGLRLWNTSSLGAGDGLTLIHDAATGDWRGGHLPVGSRIAYTASTRKLEIVGADISAGTFTGAGDHGGLTGLTDDDHTQYHTDARGDARYSALGHAHADGGGAVSRSHAWIGDGGSTEFALPEARMAGSAMVVSVNGVLQASGMSYTAVDGAVTTINFYPWAPGDGDIVACVYQIGYGGTSGGNHAVTSHTDWPSGLTVAELGYVDGARSNIQAQIDAISPMRRWRARRGL